MKPLFRYLITDSAISLHLNALSQTSIRRKSQHHRQLGTKARHLPHVYVLFLLATLTIALLQLLQVTKPPTPFLAPALAVRPALQALFDIELVVIFTALVL